MCMLERRINYFTWIVFKIFEFSLSFCACVIFMCCSSTWNKYIHATFKVVSLIGFIYPFVILVCQFFKKLKKLIYPLCDTLICSLLSILSLVAAAVITLYYENDSKVKYLILTNRTDINFVVADILEFLSGIVYFMDAYIGITYIQLEMI